jgi:hypothetical protein
VSSCDKCGRLLPGGMRAGPGGFAAIKCPACYPTAPQYPLVVVQPDPIAHHDGPAKCAHCQREMTVHIGQPLKCATCRKLAKLVQFTTEELENEVRNRKMQESPGEQPVETDAEIIQDNQLIEIVPSPRPVDEQSAYHDMCQGDSLEFIECDTCRAKPGSPDLCRGCLHNRYLISQLRAPKVADKTCCELYTFPPCHTPRSCALSAIPCDACLYNVQAGGTARHICSKTIQEKSIISGEKKSIISDEKSIIPSQNKLEVRIAELEAAIREHADQRDDDRCWLDDLKLYQVIGITHHAGLQLPEGQFLDNCKRYWRCQQIGKKYTT